MRAWEAGSNFRATVIMIVQGQRRSAMGEFPSNVLNDKGQIERPQWSYVIERLDAYPHEDFTDIDGLGRGFGSWI
jgi:hypothetical protein